MCILFFNVCRYCLTWIWRLIYVYKGTLLLDIWFCIIAWEIGFVVLEAGTVLVK